jgi:ankyrin repeat protein
MSSSTSGSTGPRTSLNLQATHEINKDQNKSNLDESPAKKRRINFREIVDVGDFACSGSGKIMTDPMQLSCSHHVDKKFYQDWSKKDKDCPKCHRKITDFVEDIFMKDVIKKWKEVKGDASTTTTITVPMNQNTFLKEATFQSPSTLQELIDILPKESKKRAIRDIDNFFDFCLKNSIEDPEKREKVNQDELKKTQEKPKLVKQLPGVISATQVNLLPPASQQQQVQQQITPMSLQHTVSMTPIVLPAPSPQEQVQQQRQFAQQFPPMTGMVSGQPFRQQPPQMNMSQLQHARPSPSPQQQPPSPQQLRPQLPPSQQQPFSQQLNLQNRWQQQQQQQLFSQQQHFQQHLWQQQQQSPPPPPPPPPQQLSPWPQQQQQQLFSQQQHFQQHLWQQQQQSPPPPPPPPQQLSPWPQQQSPQQMSIPLGSPHPLSSQQLRATNALHKYVSVNHKKRKNAVRLEVGDLLKNNLEYLNQQDEKGNTPLHIAIKRGRLGVVQALMGAKPDLNKRNLKRQTPIEMAVKSFRTKLEKKFPNEFKKNSAPNSEPNVESNVELNVELNFKPNSGSSKSQEY